MDSITQFTLGAAIGESVLGRRAGYRAALWGGICGTLPDLDTLIPFNDAVAAFTYHRSFSHSLLVLPLAAPLLVWLILRIHPHQRHLYRNWVILVLLVLVTHPLLDAFTVYGTQLFWPVYIYPVSWSTIFIVDPAYTLPLLAGVISARILRDRQSLARTLNISGLVLSSLYLLWSVAAKVYVGHQVREQLAASGQAFGNIMTTPASIHTFTWRIVLMEADGYQEGFYFLRDRGVTAEFSFYPSQPGLLEGLEQHWPVRRLQWFTHGFYRVSRAADDIIMTDLRMGQEPAYVFNFKVAEVHGSRTQAVPGQLIPGLTIRQRFETD